VLFLKIEHHITFVAVPVFDNAEVTNTFKKQFVKMVEWVEAPASVPQRQSSNL
jgi:hypothetical protein